MVARRLFFLTLISALAILTCSCVNLSSPSDWVGLDELLSADADLPAIPRVKDLAAAIDSLEKHIEKFGSIVPKHADVWGQARLMMYRQEFERVMRPDAYTFEASIQATVATSDQAYLANAFSLQAAVKGSSASSAVEASKLVSDTNDVISRNTLLPKNQIANYVTPQGKLALEPTLLEDQKQRFLYHLQELRRINDGDDNTDAPGYALNLVRIPISVMTGECTQTGYGAECTITATPHLPDDLLPQTFRNLVVNDLVGLLTVPMTRVIENTHEEDLTSLLKQYEDARAVNEDARAKKLEREQEYFEAAGAYRSKQQEAANNGLPQAPVQTLPAQQTPFADTPDGKRMQHKLETAKRDLATASSNLTTASSNLNATNMQLYRKLARVFASNNPTNPGRVNQIPIAPSQLVYTLGAHNLGYLTQALRKQVQDHVACKSAPYHLDVQAALKAELGAAYEFLSSPRGQALWRHCTPMLADAIRTQDVKTLIDIEKQFFHMDIENMVLPAEDNDKRTDPGIKIYRSITSILAWAIVIDSALLNQRFVEEMKSAHAGKGCPCPPNGWPLFFLPQPPADACQLFNDFVRCRWPLYVFAIDPETEDQNVGDSFSLRRELQLAMSLAFVSGQMSASNFTRYVRRIEQDIDTIALNRTIVGFSHGDNTFGWRFYPRVQTPPIDGNLQAAFRDLLIGGRRPAHDLRRRRLENGIRECVALVIMPSFVPYMDLEVTGNWFRLADPKCKALNLKQVMRLSQRVKMIQDAGPHAIDQDCYRSGDAQLMARRLDQLSERLPLQYQLVNVPFENTHGGFELLSTGVTNLAPELTGWYGAPGINPDGDTALFLVGNNFSVHQTRVVVGGRLLDPYCQIDCSTIPQSKSMQCTCGATQTAGSSVLQTTSTATKSTTSTSAAASPEQGGVADDGANSGVIQAGLFNRSGPWHPAPRTAITVVNRVPSLPVPTVVGPSVIDLAKSAADVQMAATETKATMDQAKAALADSKQAAASGQPDQAAAKMDAASAKTDQASKQAATTSQMASDTEAKAQTVAATSLGTAVATMKTVETYEVPHFQVELLSRQVMRVVIPKGVYSLNDFVDVHVATPYGVSAHLAIPVLCNTKKPETPSYGYAVNAKSTVKIQYALVPHTYPGGVFYKPVFLQNAGKDKIQIDWRSSTGSILNAATGNFTFSFRGQDLMPIVVDNLIPSSPDDKPAKGQNGDTGDAPTGDGSDNGAGSGAGGDNSKPDTGNFTINGQLLQQFSIALLDRLIPADPRGFAPDNVLPTSLSTKSITIRLKDSTGRFVTESVPTANQLTVQFELLPPTASMKNIQLNFEYQDKNVQPCFQLDGDSKTALKNLRIKLPGFRDDNFKLQLFLQDKSMDPDRDTLEVPLERDGATSYFKLSNDGGDLAVALARTMQRFCPAGTGKLTDYPSLIQSGRIAVHAGIAYRNIDVPVAGKLAVTLPPVALFSNASFTVKQKDRLIELDAEPKLLRLYLLGLGAAPPATFTAHLRFEGSPPCLLDLTVRKARDNGYECVSPARFVSDVAEMVALYKAVHPKTMYPITLFTTAITVPGFPTAIQTPKPENQLTITIPK